MTSRLNVLMPDAAMASTARATLSGGVRAAEAHEHVRAGRLHAQTHTVDADRAVRAQQIDGHIVGVALHGELRVVAARNRVERAHQQRCIYVRRGSASDEDGGRLGHRRRGTLDLGAQRTQIALDEMRLVGERGKRAVVALVATERHMYIDTEADVVRRSEC